MKLFTITFFSSAAYAAAFAAIAFTLKKHDAYNDDICSSLALFVLWCGLSALAYFKSSIKDVGFISVSAGWGFIAAALFVSVLCAGTSGMDWKLVPLLFLIPPVVIMITLLPAYFIGRKFRTPAKSHA